MKPDQYRTEDLHRSAVAMIPHLRRSGLDLEKHAQLLYRPPRLLGEYIEDFQDYLDTQPPKRGKARREALQEGGRLLEQIAYLAFRSIQGVGSIESFVSAGPQYDLLVSGGSALWSFLTRLLGLPSGRESSVVEAKAYHGEGKKVPHDEMARLCSIVDHQIPTLAGLGVFFTSWGASGDGQQCLRYARLLQALFFARTRVPIVVLNFSEIRRLTKPGELLVILSRKIRQLEELGSYDEVTGLNLRPLPTHLQELADELNGSSTAAN